MHEVEQKGISAGVFFSGFIVGLFTGSVIALLTAPQSGGKTREKIEEKSLELRGKAVNTIEDALLQAERAMTSARETTGHAIERTRRQIEQLEARGEEILDGQRQRFNRIVDEVRHREQY
jgi:gas vesicle protein